MHSIQDRVERAKRDVFLRAVADRSEGDDGSAQTGLIGDWLGLPYEEALRLTEELTADGFLESEGPLHPPSGPTVRLTNTGAYAAAKLHAA